MKAITRESLLSALNERDLFNNPDLLIHAADEVDCGGFGECEYVRDPHRSETGCCKADRGEYCPNDLAYTLRALAALARRDGETPT